MAFVRNISGMWAFISTVALVAIGGWLATADQGVGRGVHVPRPGRRPDARRQAAFVDRPSRCCSWAATAGCHEFNPKLAKEAQKTSPRFFGYSPSEMKTVLQQEFGKQFDVSTTRHYLVVHPAGERDQWANRFEDLYNRFEHYFRVRGFSLSEPPYPLVAIVFRDQAEYFRHADASGTPMRPDTLGHYDPTSNRVFLFDVTTDAGDDWSENADTIIHEATHQTAYNVGIHKRFTAAPRWLVEGLATMFEARGVWNAQYDRSQTDRINRGRLLGFPRLRGHAPASRGAGRAAFVRRGVPQRRESARTPRRGRCRSTCAKRSRGCTPPTWRKRPTAAVQRLPGGRANGRLPGHLRQRDEDVRDKFLRYMEEVK